MYAFSRYRDQYVANLKLALPVVLSQVGQVLVQFFDNAMVGRLGALPLAAVSLGGSVNFILFIFGIGLTLGITPIVGAHFARHEHDRAAACLQSALVLYTAMGLVIGAMQLAAIPLMRHMGQPPEVVEMAIPYYRLIVIGIVPTMLYGAFKQFLEGIGNTVAAMLVVLTCNSVNVALNWVFIYGHLGAEPMGAVGAGLATLISRILMPCMMLGFFLLSPTARNYLGRMRHLRFDWGRVRELIRVGAPIGGQMMLEGSAFVITAIMMGWIGTVQIAANQVATIVSNFAFMIVLGISSATTIRIAHTWGSRRFGEMHRAARAAYHIGLAWNLFTAVVFILLREQLPLLFTRDEAVVAVASKLFVLVALFQISDGLQAISIGILRGMKDVASTLWIAFIAYILINVPVGYLCAFVLGWGAEGLWIGFIFGLSIAALLLNARYRYLLHRMPPVRPAASRGIVRSQSPCRR